MEKIITCGFFLCYEKYTKIRDNCFLVYCWYMFKKNTLYYSLSFLKRGGGLKLLLNFFLGVCLRTENIGIKRDVSNYLSFNFIFKVFYEWRGVTGKGSYFLVKSVAASVGKNRVRIIP